ncbi:hypothetical protein D3Z51_00725 [Clostridiaceae bacterium]|nr:hypothetical protein [Clostridiaceae bacterium]RKI16441.1 hypothetical protein D7V81_04180 [bacterium 1XD21-70]
MRAIWYLLKCPAGDEADYVREYQKMMPSGKLQEVICFQYQRMLRYGGQWHLERRTLLPGCVFLSGSERSLPEADMSVQDVKKGRQTGARAGGGENRISLTPCEPPFWKTLCQKDYLLPMSRGIIKDGSPIVTGGPLVGHEGLIRRIDRHKRTAEIGVPFAGQEMRVTVGLEIYQKQI